jgi:hypothetical protein
MPAARCRLIPNRRFVISSLVAAGSTALGLLRWVYGHWLPSLSTVLRSPYFMAYVAISAVVGACLTYVFDNTGNEKLNNILRSVLHAIGLALVARSTTSWEASGAMVGLLLLAYNLQGVVRWAGMGPWMYEVSVV